MRSYLTVIVLCVVALGTRAAVPAQHSLATDPVPDAKHPASLEVLHIPSGGVEIYGIAYTPPGSGPHPIAVFCHGMPGNEKNLDLAQAARRAGWVAVYFNYRGAWGAAGPYSPAGAIDDTEAVLTYLRDAEHATFLHADPSRIVLIGHSFGGNVVVTTAARDRGLKGIVMISAGDMERIADAPPAARLAFAETAIDGLADMTPQKLVDELMRDKDVLSFKTATPRLVDTPLLALYSDDGLAAHTTDLVAGIRAAGGHKVTALHVATDHSWSDRRVLLQTTVLDWINRLR